MKAWTDPELEILKSCYAEGVKLQDISDFIFEDFGIRRTLDGIKSKAYKLKLVPPPVKIRTTEGWDDFSIIVPTSGGKDSLACLLLAIGTGREVIPVFNDTGWEHPLTYEYLDYLETTLDLKIHRTKDGDIPSLVRKKRRFPFGMGRFCTSYLKQANFRNYYRDELYSPDKKYEIWFGMRTEESTKRARKYFGITADDLFDINDLFANIYGKKLRATLRARLPVADWTTKEIFSYISPFKVNPLYSLGDKRVGCYPCMLASKKVQEAQLNTEFGKERLEIIKQLEIDIGQKYEMFDTDQGSCELCKI